MRLLDGVDGCDVAKRKLSAVREKNNPEQLQADIFCHDVTAADERQMVST